MEIIENRDAQFMLLAGFIIAIGLVITTVMLNGIIFEGNMAVGTGTDPSKNEIINLMQITQDETRAAYRIAANIGWSKTIMISNFTNQTQNFRDNLSTIYATHGEGVNVSWDVSNWNNSLFAYFTDNGTASGIANWTVIQNVTNSNITVNVTAGTFYINLTNSTPDWQINLSAPSVNYINTSNNSGYNIIFINGANAAGNFSINGTASGKKFTRARDYILNATVTFSTSRVRANITIPVTVPW